MPYNIQTNLNVQATGNLNTAVSFATPVGFRLTLDRLKFPNVEFAIQTIALPDISMQGAQHSMPQRNIFATPDKIDYNPFECTFLVDENLDNYKEIHDWMLGLIREADTKEYKKTRDMTLHILTSHNNVTKKIQFIDAFPTNLSSLPFDTTVTDTNYLVASVTFQYSYFKFV